MAEPKVSTSTRLWSEEVARADAIDTMDYAGPGMAGVMALVDKQRPVNYEFAGGKRLFRQPKDPYA